MIHWDASGFVLIIFMSVTTFALMNVVIAVIVENTLDLARNRDEDLNQRVDAERKAALEKIYEVFKIADLDGNGDLTKEEFMVALRDPEVKRNLHGVDIDLRGAEGLFDILDFDLSGNLDIAEFIEGCMRARGGAKAKDVLAVQCDLWRTQHWIRARLDEVDEILQKKFDALEE